MKGAIRLIATILAFVPSIFVLGLECRTPDVQAATAGFQDKTTDVDESAGGVVRRLEGYLNRLEALGVSGQITVIEKGNIKAFRGVGFSYDGVVNSERTVFSIASLSKQFTAAAILSLEEDGKLKLTDTLAKVLADVPDDKASITVHHLLTHSSGLPRGQDGRRNITRESAVASALKQPLAFKSGERFAYSNLGYQLLAAIIEKTSARTYTDYLRERLFVPTGLTRTAFYQDAGLDARLVPVPYNEWSRLPTFLEWGKGWNHGSGSIVSNAGDLARWFHSLKSGKVLSSQQTARLFTPHISTNDPNVHYGYGFFLRKNRDGSQSIYHGGDLPGYHSELQYSPKHDRLVIVLANYEYLEPDGVAVQKRLIAEDLDKIFSNDGPRDSPPVRMPSPREIKHSVGEYSLNANNKLKVWQYGRHLAIGAEGQEAIDLITGSSIDASRKFHAANHLTSSILNNLKEGTVDKIKALLPGTDYENYVPFLAEEIANYEKRLGGLKAVRVQGSAAFPWDSIGFRTFSVLQFEKGTIDLFFGWRNGGLEDVTTETGRPFPIIMTLAPESAAEFSTFDLISRKRTKFSFRGNRLIVRSDSPGRNGVFRRL